MSTHRPPAVTIRIGGNRLESGGGGLHRHISPVTGRADAVVPLAGPSEVNTAVEAAARAFPSWWRTPPVERGKVLLRLADLLQENAVEVGRLTAFDNGTPISSGQNAAYIAADWTRYYAGLADKPHSQILESFTENAELGYTLAQPYGVIGAIITWNAPVMSLAMKVPAALAAGNAVVVKPSELTPFGPQLFAELAEQAGVPDGVLSMLPGTADAGVALVEHPGVGKISFTGGPGAATEIMRICAESAKPVVMELGGKSANIVLEDADVDAACVHGAFMSVGVFSGQGCALPTRMLVHDSIYDEVVEKVVAIVSGIAVGDPFDMTTLSGPVISDQAMARILAMVQRAQRDGATLLAGGTRLGDKLADGFFVAPTVLGDVDPDSELAQQEVFGPVLAIVRFGDDEAAVRIANGTPYGLSSCIQTRDLRRALVIAEQLTAGEVLINGALNADVRRPFGGFGSSGIGKEGGLQGLAEFQRIKSVAVR